MVEVSASSSAVDPRAGGMLVPIGADFRGQHPPKGFRNFWFILWGFSMS